MRFHHLLKRNFKILSVIGIFCSWLTIALIWGEFGNLPLISFAFTGGVFGLAFVGTIPN